MPPASGSAWDKSLLKDRRLLRLGWHLVEGLATCAIVFPFVGKARRNRLIHRWSRRLVTLCGITLHIEDRHGGLAERALIVANHISWLDIFVINSMEPCRFVAKSEIRDWPLIGWLCAKTGTIFISRGNRRDVRRIYEGLVDSIRAGDRIAFFPEGGVSSQGNVLPFHANLFEAAVEAKVPVQPLALRYVDVSGHYHPAADFTGDMSFLDSLFLILRSPSIHVKLATLAPIGTNDTHRRELAEATRQAIIECLREHEQNFKLKLGRGDAVL